MFKMDTARQNISNYCASLENNLQQFSYKEEKSETSLNFSLRI